MYKRQPDLSRIEADLQKVAHKYRITEGEPQTVVRKCHECADQMLKLIRKEGYAADIVRFELPSRSGWIGTLDNRTVSTNGWHEMVRISAPGKVDVFLDAEIFPKNRNPVPFSYFTRFYKDADLFIQVSQR